MPAPLYRSCFQGRTFMPRGAGCVTTWLCHVTSVCCKAPFFFKLQCITGQVTNLNGKPGDIFGDRQQRDGRIEGRCCARAGHKAWYVD